MMDALRSEIRKVFTTKLWWGLALGMAAMAFAVSMGAAALVNLEPGGLASNAASSQVVFTAGLLGQFGSLTALFPLALGVLLITSEFRHQTITATYLAVPKRGVVAVAKFISVIVVGVLYGVVHATAAVGGGAVILTTVKDVPLFLGDSDVQQSLLLTPLAVTVWALLGFGFGMLVRNQIAATLIAVGFAFLGQLMLNIIFSVLEWWTPMKFLPGNLTSQMLVTSDPSADPGTSDQAMFVPFDAGTSALILIAYAVILTVIGSWLTARRDIS